MSLCATELHERIQRAYDDGPYELGWRFLYSPAAVLSGADVAFIGLNPAGESFGPPQFDTPEGSAYAIEDWWGTSRPGSAPLQAQVLSLFEKLGVAPEAVLAGNFVPFRSRDWKSLQDKSKALEFSRDLWADVLIRVRPRLIIAMGTVVRDELAGLLGIKLDHQPVGWGNITASRGRTPTTTLLALPHLSRYKIMAREASQPWIDQLFADIEHKPLQLNNPHLGKA